jgi:hypothetical protein
MFEHGPFRVKLLYQPLSEYQHLHRSEHVEVEPLVLGDIWREITENRLIGSFAT